MRDRGRCYSVPMLDRDGFALIPPLYGRMRLMTELAGHGADTAEAINYGGVIDHSPTVRAHRTAVKLDRIQVYARYTVPMTDHEDTLGKKMRALKDRAGLSLGDIASELEKARSSIQRFFEKDYKPGGMLSLEEAIMFAGVFVGKGKPPIQSDDIFGLTALRSLPAEAAFPPSGLDGLSKEVAEAVARALIRVVNPGQEPPEETVEVLAEMLRELAELYRRDPAMRSDAARTTGALQLLGMQLSRQGRELQ